MDRIAPPGARGGYQTREAYQKDRYERDIAW